MSVTTQQPGTIGYGTMSSSGEWSSGLFDCCDDCGICLFGLCLPSCLGCYVAKQYGENCLLPCVPGGLTALRTHMRLSYGIQDTVCKDALLITFCGWCELCRMAREIKRRSH